MMNKCETLDNDAGCIKFHHGLFHPRPPQDKTKTGHARGQLPVVDSAPCGACKPAPNDANLAVLQQCTRSISLGGTTGLGKQDDKKDRDTTDVAHGLMHQRRTAVRKLLIHALCITYLQVVLPKPASAGLRHILPHASFHTTTPLHTTLRRPA